MENPFYQKPQKNLRESRSSVHAEIPITVVYCCPSAKEEIRVHGRVADISEKGILFVSLEQGIPPGAEVRATFQLPCLDIDPPIKFMGKALRSKSIEGNQYATGVEFKEISTTNLRSIRSFVSLQQLGETL